MKELDPRWSIETKLWQDNIYAYLKKSTVGTRYMLR